MKKTQILCLYVMSILLLSCGNYRYVYKSSCNCVMNKDNPEGIVMVSMFPYMTDPEIHEHNAGFYSKTVTAKVTRFSLDDFNPKEFSCQPCLAFITDKNYVFLFKGKKGKGDVALRFSKDSQGKIRELR